MGPWAFLGGLVSNWEELAEVGARSVRCESVRPRSAHRHSSGQLRALWLAFGGVFGTGWPMWAPGAARACVTRVGRRVTGERAHVSAPHVAMCHVPQWAIICDDVRWKRATDGTDSPEALAVGSSGGRPDHAGAAVAFWFLAVAGLVGCGCGQNS